MRLDREWPISWQVSSLSRIFLLPTSYSQFDRWSHAQGLKLEREGEGGGEEQGEV